MSRPRSPRASTCGALLALAAASCGGGAPAPAHPAPSASGQTATDKPADGPSSATKLLSDRLRIELPPGARLEPRGHSIMAADEPDAEETRVVIDAGDERMVIMAYELFARAGKDPERSVRAEATLTFDDKPPSVERATLADPSLPAWFVALAITDRSRTAIPVLGLYTLHPDGFAQALVAYVNPQAAKSPEGCNALAGAMTRPLPKLPGDLSQCRAIARSILATVRPGPRRIDAAGGERTLKGQYDDDTFLLKVPPGTSITMQQGPDFTVHHVRLAAELGTEQPALGIYVGGHPSYQYEQQDANVTPAPRAGKVFGTSIQWQVWPMSAGRVMAEVIVPHPKSKGTQIHLFAEAPDDKALAAVLDMATSLRLP